MKVLLFALTASTASAFAPSAFGVRRTFLGVDILSDGGRIFLRSEILGAGAQML
jgi:hypothetical protein